MNDSESPPKEKERFFTRKLPLETATCVFILVSAFDVFMTFILLNMDNFRESNGIANWILTEFGFRGMVYFKFALVLVVVLIAQIHCHASNQNGPTFTARRVDHYAVRRDLQHLPASFATAVFSLSSKQIGNDNSRC